MTILIDREVEQAEQIPHWDKIARTYFALGSPLRPCAEDVATMQQLIAQIDCAKGGGGVNALMWGVTPALAEMAWPAGSRLRAVDQSSGMIDQVWPGDRPPHRQAQCSNWLATAVAPHSYDVVIGDGSFNCLTYPTFYQQLAAVSYRALRPRGALIVRFFMRPDQPEPVEAVLAAAMQGQIGSFDAFRWRLVMAILGREAVNIAMYDVWKAWQQVKLDRNQLMQRTGWSADNLHAIDAYQHSDAVFSFPTLAEIRAGLIDWFEIGEIYTSTYELGERCPIIVLRPK